MPLHQAPAKRHAAAKALSLRQFSQKIVRARKGRGSYKRIKGA